MTRQNRIHKCVRKSEQDRKTLIRGWDRRGKPLPHHSRKWWKAWHKTMYAKLNSEEKEKKNE